MRIQIIREVKPSTDDVFEDEPTTLEAKIAKKEAELEALLTPEEEDNTSIGEVVSTKWNGLKERVSSKVEEARREAHQKKVAEATGRLTELKALQAMQDGEAPTLRQVNDA